VNHSSAVNEAVSPAVSGYKSSWNNSDYNDNTALLIDSAGA